MKHKWGGRDGLKCFRCDLVRMQSSAPTTKGWKWIYVKNSRLIDGGRVIETRKTAGDCPGGKDA